MSAVPDPYRDRLERLRTAMHAARIDVLATNYGPDFTWLTGLNKPVAYDVGKGHGDWVNLLLVPLDGDPTVLVNPSWGMDISGSKCSDLRGNEEVTTGEVGIESAQPPGREQ